MSMWLKNVLATLYGPVWDIQPEAFRAICDVVDRKLSGVRLTQDEIADRIGSGRKSESGPRISGGVAVIPVMGVLAHRMGMFDDISGGTSTERLGKEFDALAADPSVGAIVLDISSPGGTHAGLEEIANRIHAARNGVRPIIAIANDLAASAGYWIASAADEIWVTPGGLLGCIGSMMIHREDSEMQAKLGIKTTLIASSSKKIEGNSDEPLSDEARAYLQAGVDLAASEFIAGVARNRGITSDQVTAQYGEGRVYTGKEALARGLADRVGTLDEVLIDLGVKKTAPTGSGTTDKADVGEVHHTVATRRMRQHIRNR